jgi:hypothetical protein
VAYSAWLSSFMKSECGSNPQKEICSGKMSTSLTS